MNILPRSTGLVAGKNCRKFLIAILLLGLLLRIVMAFFTPLPNMHRDSYEYYFQADILLMGRYLNYFPNGYPLIVALAKLLAPIGPAPILLWINIGMSTLTIYFVYDIGIRVFQNSSIALLAALIMAVFPPQLNYVRWLMSEVPTIFFLTGAYFFYCRKKYWHSGLFFGLVTIVRTNVMPIFVLLLIAELVFRRKLNYKLLIAAVIPILLVGSYCFFKTGVFSIEGNDRVNILYSVTASGSHIDFRMGEKYPEINTSGKAMKMYFDHMKKSPVEFVGQRLANLWELWGFYASGADGFRNPIFRLVLGACNFFLIVFGLFGWWMNRKYFLASILILPFLVVTISITMLVAIPRYAYPVHPFMILFGAWSVFFLYEYRRGTPDKPGKIPEAI
jgi:hypothetical protein